MRRLEPQFEEAYDSREDRQSGFARLLRGRRQREDQWEEEDWSDAGEDRWHAEADAACYVDTDAYPDAYADDDFHLTAPEGPETAATVDNPTLIIGPHGWQSGARSPHDRQADWTGTLDGRNAAAGNLSPGDIITRAAAIVPENVDATSEKNNLMPGSGAWAEGLRPQPRRSRAEPPDRRQRRNSRLRLTFLPRLRPAAWLAPVTRLVGGSGRLRLAGRALAAVFIASVLGLLITSDHLSRAAGWVASEMSGNGAHEASGEVPGDLVQGNNAGTVKVRRIEIKGRRNTSQKKLEAALSIREGDDLMNVDLASARERIERLPWVAAAAVERHLSGTVIVRLTEHRAIARLRTPRGNTLIGADGKVIPVTAPANAAGLVLLDGTGAAAEAPALMTLLNRHPRLASKVVAARRFGRRRWDLRLKNGALIRLPAGFAVAAWDKLQELDSKHGLLIRGRMIFDMRLPDRMIIRADLTPSADMPKDVVRRLSPANGAKARDKSAAKAAGDAEAATRVRRLIPRARRPARTTGRRAQVDTRARVRRLSRRRTQ